MLTKDQLKEKLLALACFEDNEYFKKYVELCVSNANTKKAKYITNIHHIIPRKYFKFNKLEIDNSPENLVNLHYYDHILAHYYLVLCSIPGYLQYANAVAFVMSIGKGADKNILTPEDIKQIKDLDQYIKVYENYKGKPRSKEHCAALSKARDYHSSTKGRKSMYNPALNKVKFVNPTEITVYLQEGWVVGGKPMTEAAKQKIGRSNSIALKGKKHTSIKPNKLNAGLEGSKILCIETGQIFENIQEAKNWLYKHTGVEGGQIKNCCAGSRKSTGGYSWKYYVEA